MVEVPIVNRDLRSALLWKARGRYVCQQFLYLGDSYFPKFGIALACLNSRTSAPKKSRTLARGGTDEGFIAAIRHPVVDPPNLGHSRRCSPIFGNLHRSG